MEERRESQPRLIITRVFNAPRDLVFRAFTDAAHLAHWWGPTGFELRVHQLDLRPGGIFHYSMQAPNGNTMWGKFVYRSIKVPLEIVFVSSFSDEKGNVIKAPFPGLVFPLEVLNHWSFEDRNGQTAITLHAVPLNATEEETKGFAGLHASMNEGYGGTFDKLDAYLRTIA